MTKRYNYQQIQLEDLLLQITSILKLKKLLSKLSKLMEAQLQSEWLIQKLSRIGIMNPITVFFMIYRRIAGVIWNVLVWFFALGARGRGFYV
jgi:hypothetical protein